MAVTAIQATAYTTGTEMLTYTNTDFLMYIEKIIQTEMESGVMSFVNLSQKTPHIIYTASVYARGLCSRIQGVKCNAKSYTV